MAVQIEMKTPTRNRDAEKAEIKILAVDDREDNLLSIETILEREGYTIHKALSGRAALKILLNQHDYTLILMDVQMPDMNGFETASLIYERDRLRHIPIIFITAHNQNEEYVFKGYKTGGVDFIYKPINPELLRFKVSVFAELYRKNHQLMIQERRLKEVNQSLQREIEERRASEEKVKRLNEQLVENNTELKTINEELDRFAYVASHDLQEPLRKIMLFSDTLTVKLKESNDPELQNSLDRIVRASHRMQTLINDLLKLSRHTHHADDFKYTDLNSVVADVLFELDSDMQSKHAVVSYRDLPAIRAVPGQVYQLFQNLITNALKFSKKDTAPLIDIYAETLKGSEIPGTPQALLDTTFHRIYIRDNGIGFDPTFAEEIFVVFKRLHSFHEFQGTGIGLSLCRKIVERHRGTIRAEGVPQQGATFIITLPQLTELALA